MRKQSVECETPEEAFRACPWADVVMPVEGGFMCFESPQEAYVWENQK